MKINKLNYEALALEYLEGTLSKEELLAMEQFLSKHPSIQAELEEMKDFLVLTPEPIKFKNKKKLLKVSSEDRVLWMTSWKWSIAASILLLVALLIYPKEQSFDSIATIPTIENTVENTSTMPKEQLSNKGSAKAVVAQVSDTSEGVRHFRQPTNILLSDESQEVKTTINQLASVVLANEKEALSLNRSMPQKSQIETVEAHRIAAQSEVVDRISKVIKHQELITQIVENPIVQSDKPNEKSINIDPLVTTDIALLKVPVVLPEIMIDTQLTMSNMLAKAETQKRRTFKSLIGKLPGTTNGIKISVIPSFFTD